MKIRLKSCTKQKGEMHAKVLRYRHAWCVLGITKEGVNKRRDGGKWALGISMGQDHMKIRESLRTPA